MKIEITVYATGKAKKKTLQWRTWAFIDYLVYNLNNKDVTKVTLKKVLK